MQKKLSKMMIKIKNILKIMIIKIKIIQVIIIVKGKIKMQGKILRKVNINKGNNRILKLKIMMKIIFIN
jgi:hypothetical protein